MLSKALMYLRAGIPEETRSDLKWVVGKIKTLACFLRDFWQDEHGRSIVGGYTFIVMGFAALGYVYGGAAQVFGGIMAFGGGMLGKAAYCMWIDYVREHAEG